MSRKLRFLAIDDDPVFLLVLSRMMQAMGYDDPAIAHSGREALSLLSPPTHRFDCILLDIQMPEMDGIETCRRIRALRHHRDTPIMMVTTLNARSHVDAAFAVGATDYLTKPLKKIELNARLGMINLLIQERTRARALEDQMEAVSDLPGFSFKFDDPVPLPLSDQLIDYLALENHLLTLNRLSLHSYAAMAFHVVNASQIYDNFDRMDYLDLMSHVGGAVAQALKTYRYLMAHAGRGEFVAVLHLSASLDRDEIAHNIEMQLQSIGGAITAFGLPVPSVRVGSPQRSGLFSTSAVERLLQRARAASRFEEEGIVTAFNI